MPSPIMSTLARERAPLTMPRAANDQGAAPRLAAKAPITIACFDDGPTQDYRRRSIIMVDGKSERVGYDWNGWAHRDTSDWPARRELAKQDGQRRLQTAERYRALTAAAQRAVFLNGSPIARNDNLRLDQRVWNRPDGDVENKGVRKSAGKPTEPLPHMQAQALTGTADGQNLAATRLWRVQEPWSGDDAINAAIDARTLLGRAHAALGPLRRPIDDLLVNDLTLKAVGEKLGRNNAIQASGAAAAILDLGLDVLASLFDEVDADEAAFKAKQQHLREV